jgi:hypothetical protein
VDLALPVSHSYHAVPASAFLTSAVYLPLAISIAQAIVRSVGQVGDAAPNQPSWQPGPWVRATAGHWRSALLVVRNLSWRFPLSKVLALLAKLVVVAAGGTVVSRRSLAPSLGYSGHSSWS